MTHKLIATWRRFKVSKPPFILKEDRNILISNNYCDVFRSFKEYIQNNRFNDRNDDLLHVGLFPIPYSGALDHASIFLLQLNPGLSHGDYFAEYETKIFRRAQRYSLHQKFNDCDFPFIYLNPTFSWHPGYVYWQKKLHEIILKLKDKYKCSYQKASSILSKNIALLELVPYHSKIFGAHTLLNTLFSVELVKSYVRDILVPKANNNKITIIVMRKGEIWGIPKETENIIVYKATESRSAHLGLKSRGGKAIGKRMGLKI